MPLCHALDEGGKFLKHLKILLLWMVWSCMMLPEMFLPTSHCAFILPILGSHFLFLRTPFLLLKPARTIKIIRKRYSAKQSHRRIAYAVPMRLHQKCNSQVKSNFYAAKMSLQLE
jgi:hypothetical protein